MRNLRQAGAAFSFTAGALDEARDVRPGPSDPGRRATQSLPTPSPEVVSRRLGDEVVLVHLKTNRIFSLSPTGARFWELLAAGRGRSEIEATLLQEYDVTPEAVSAEIDSLVGMLEAERLVQEG